MENNRFCRKCLLADLDDEKIRKEIIDAKDRLSAADRADESVYKARLDECLKCDRLENATCNACGCYVELRAAAVRGNCPYRKWDKV